MSKEPSVIPQPQPSGTSVFGAAALSAAFAVTIGFGFGYNTTKEQAKEEARIEAQREVRKLSRELSELKSSQDAHYYAVCWSLRAAAQQGTKLMKNGQPFVVEMNQYTSEHCPMTPIPNVKMKIAY